MPGPISESYKGPGASAPYVPSWCFDPPGPRMCKCGHHEGYHNDAGVCLCGRCKAAEYSENASE
jgi:hypothetical protein